MVMMKKREKKVAIDSTDWVLIVKQLRDRLPSNVALGIGNVIELMSCSGTVFTRKYPDPEISFAAFVSMVT